MLVICIPVGAAIRTEETLQQQKHSPRPREWRLALGDYVAYAGQALAKAREEGAEILRLSVPMPPTPLWEQPEGAILWCPPRGPSCVAARAICEIRAEGSQRFRRVATLGDAIWEKVADHPHPAVRPCAMRLYGGFSFSAEAQREEWEGFGQARFFLPEREYYRDGERAWLSICVGTAENAEDVADRLHYEEGRRMASNSHHVPVRISRRENLPEEIWRVEVEKIRDAIRAGEVEKIVAARKTTLHFSEDIVLRTALKCLSEKYRDCFRFGFERDGRCFVGASPESLIGKRGRSIETEALAGSIALAPQRGNATDGVAERALLHSAKDLEEQNYVVRAIASALEPLCERFVCSESPQIKTLRHLAHLCTPITGELASDHHILHLVEKLHPTPAVGGVPRQAAMEWISDNECGRGWYAGPVGWFDRDGDGHFAVAIRSALLAGKTAQLYAGAGIVRDSQPGLEYDETELKNRAMLDALGISS